MLEQVDGARAKYAGYIERQLAEIARARGQETTAIARPAFDYAAGAAACRTEVRQKLSETRAPAKRSGRPQRVPGVTPAAISLLLVHLERRRRERAA